MGPVAEAHELNIEVDALPPPPPPGPMPPPEPTPPPEAVEWSAEDIAALTQLVRMPYNLAATTAGEYWRLSETEERAIVVSLTDVIPVEWVREQKRKSPILAGIVAVVTVVSVTAPRVQRFVEERRAKFAAAGQADRPRPAPAESSSDRGRDDGAGRSEVRGGAESNGPRSPIVNLRNL
jgi:hypothetical protein